MVTNIVEISRIIKPRRGEVINKLRARRLVCEISNVTKDICFTDRANEDMGKKRVTNAQIVAALRSGELVNDPEWSIANKAWECETAHSLVAGQDIKILFAIYINDDSDGERCQIIVYSIHSRA